MNPVGPDQEFSFTLPRQNQEEVQKPTVDMSQQMWDYKNRGIYQGIPVEDEAKDLLVNSVDQLQQVLQPKTSAVVWTGYISPQEADQKYVKQYQEIKQKQVQGRISILHENTQFCPSLNKFLILITYMNVQLGLNPRYKHLKEGSNG